MVSMAERGISIPESATKPFMKPEVNSGAVGVLEKPREVREPINISPTESTASPEVARKHNYKEILNKTQIFGWPSSIDIKKTWYGNNGFQISAKPTEQNAGGKKVVPGDTARHEATHAVPAVINGTPVEEVSIIPGPGYLGITKLGRPDPISALAPHATGGRGTGHDVFIASLMVDNINSVANVAKSIAYNNAEEIEEVASVLEEKKTITGYEVKEAMNRVDKKKGQNNLATVFIKNPDGSEEQIPHLEVKNGIVILPPKEQVIPNQYYELPKEGLIFSRN